MWHLDEQMSTPQTYCSRQEDPKNGQSNSISADSDSLSTEPLVMASNMVFSSPREAIWESQSRSIKFWTSVKKNLYQMLPFHKSLHYPTQIPVIELVYPSASHCESWLIIAHKCSFSEKLPSAIRESNLLLGGYAHSPQPQGRGRAQPTASG